MDYDAKFIAKRVIIDIILLLCVGFPILLYFLLGDPYKRGFFCDDESLKHPYKESSVPSYYLYIFGLGMPVTLMLITEFVQNRHDTTRALHVGKKRIPSWVWSAYCVIIVFGFGAACSQLLTDIIKYTVGRLRPHFFTVCQPTINCSLPMFHNLYIESFKCKDDQDGRLLKEMRLSFPSGHSSFSMYTMFYLAIYIQARWTWQGSKLCRHFCQYGFILLSVYTGMTRVSDYKHHWSDVLAGLFLGMFVASMVWIGNSSFGSTVTQIQSKGPTEKFVSDLFDRKPDLLPTIVDGSEEMTSRNRNGTSPS